MSTLHELGAAVRARRADIGLTQQALARLSGVSRSTVNAVETKAIHNLSITKAAKLLESIGLSLEISSGESSSRKSPPARSAVARAAATASVSYEPPLGVERLRQALLTGQAPPAIQPHLQILLDEAPMSLLAKVVEELHAEDGIDRRQVWGNMRSLAHTLKCFRKVWA